ncbi:MAG: hypothetical protein Aureis2KO_00470 [Aureisphaera sp.]
MKRIVLIICLISYVGGTAQNDCIASEILNKKQLKETEDAVKLFWKWDTIDEPERAVRMLSDINKRDPSNWIAPFWASYITTQLSNQREEIKESLEELNKAQEFLDEANKIYSKGSLPCFKPYFHALQTLIYTLKRYAYEGLKEQEKVKHFAELQLSELNKGIKLDINNPVLMVLAGTGLASRSNNDLSSIIAAISLLEKAKKEFEQIQNRSPADIGYMNEHWVAPWLKRLAPPSN